MVDNKFCYLKGMVDCSSSTIQDCNGKRSKECPLVKKGQSFCFLKGLVDCNDGRIQDCNIKRVNHCMLEDEES